MLTNRLARSCLSYSGANLNWPSMKKNLLLFGLFVGAILLFAAVSGPALVVDRPEKSDTIVVLGGDRDDIRYRRGMELLRAGYAQHLLLNASEEGKSYGHTPAEYASRFIAETAGDLAPRVSVCPYRGDSTFTETQYVSRCLEKLSARTVLLVTSSSHTRRALSIFKTRLPQYRWSVAAAADPRSWNPRWWRRRDWAKTHVMEWKRMIWWQLVDRWRS